MSLACARFCVQALPIRHTSIYQQCQCAVLLAFPASGQAYILSFEQFSFIANPLNKYLKITLFIWHRIVINPISLINTSHRQRLLCFQ
tara:strand:- start:534 stop:797 length:264 start_codon:yes stop_codon:yes gene_type:complete